MRASALFALSIALAGCGGATEGTGSTKTDEREFSQGCEALAREACDRRELCDAPGGSGQRFESSLECRERWALACRWWAGEPDARLTSRDVEDCTVELAESSCGAISRLAGSTAARLPACLRIPGARAEGARCTSDSQCTTSFCKYERTGATCAVPPAEPGYDGDACGPGAPCAGSLRCEEDRCVRGDCAATGCFSYHGSCGGIMNPGRVCQAGTECVNQNDMGAGQCAPYAREGEACGEYQGPRCLFPARCVDATCLGPAG